MNDYNISVSQVEEWQMTNNADELQKVFARAKSAVVNGAQVNLVRKSTDGRITKFDGMDTLEALEDYRKQVFKYIKE